MNNAAKLALALALLGLAGFFVFRFVAAPTSTDVVMEQETIWKCTNASCKNVFRVKRKELLVNQRETGTSLPKCPKCSTLASEVYECQFCKEVFEPVGHGSYPDNCPHCGKNLAGDASKDLAKPKPEKKTPGGHG